MERIKPEWIEFNPTMICQGSLVTEQPSVPGRLRGCSYCYAVDGLPQSAEEARALVSKELSTRDVVDLFIQAEQLEISRTCILGGEPQAREDFSKIIGVACEKIPLVHLSTNGIGTEKNLDTLLKVGILDIGVDSYDFAVASKTRPPELVKAAYEAIDILHNKHPFLCLNVVITPQSLPTLWQTVDWAFEKGIKKVNLYPLLDGGQENLVISRENAAEIAKHARENYPVIQETRCKGGEHVVIDSDGTVIPCAAFIGEDVVIGYAGDLKSALSNPLFLKLAKYDYEAVAPEDGGDFVSAGCPAKKLYNSGWENGLVEEKSSGEGSEDTEKSYCMRCSMNNCQNDGGCNYCGFEHFDTKPFSMVCNSFSVMNPKVFGTQDTG